MKRVVLKDRSGRCIIFEPQELAGLRTSELQRLIAGESITYRKVEYRFDYVDEEGCWWYRENAPWMGLHPLVQLDEQLRRKVDGQGEARAKDRPKGG